MTPDRRQSFVATVWLVTKKDLLIEFRSREVVYTTLFFAVACVLVFAFGFVREGVAVDDAAAGILWIAIAFSGTLALGRTFERERQNDTLRALLLTPVGSSCALCREADRRAPAPRRRRGNRDAARGADVPRAAARISTAHGIAAGRGDDWVCSSRDAVRGDARSGAGAATCCCRFCCIRLQSQ